jgi:hypothetical protein
MLSVCDDGSEDDSSVTKNQSFPKFDFEKMKNSKGYIYCRNYMLNITEAAMRYH